MNPIKQLIEHEKITQKEFAEKIGVKQQYVNKLINENVGIGTSVLKKIAAHYPHINLKWLLGLSGQMMLTEEESGFHEVDNLVQYLNKNNEQLLKNPIFREFIKSNIEVLGIENEEKILKEKKAQVKAAFKERLKKKS